MPLDITFPQCVEKQSIFQKWISSETYKVQKCQYWKLGKHLHVWSLSLPFADKKTESQGVEIVTLIVKNGSFRTILNKVQRLSKCLTIPMNKIPYPSIPELSLFLLQEIYTREIQ